MISNLFRNIVRLAFIVTIAAAMSLIALGQSNTGSITGVIADQNGAVLPNATVTITNQGTNEKRNTQTDSAGRYEVPSLPTGIYTVEAVANGFKASTVKDLRLAVGEKARADVSLGLSGVDAVVTVVPQTRTDTEGSTIGDTVASERITDNPVNGRDFTQLLATVPGSIQTTNQFQTSINGIASTFGGSSVLVDGIDAGRVDLNGTSNVLGRIESRVNRVSMDSVQEVQVLEQNYSAQYGDAIGAVINPITKSGTNNFHGSVFDYFRNEAMDSDDFFAGKQKFRLNQFGGNFSGPIKRDKLFFFANYEGVRQTRGVQFNTLVPTAAFRSEFVPSIAPILATMPLPNHIVSDPGTDPDADGVDEFQGYTAQRDAKLREDTGSVKIDWLQSARSQFTVRYNINDSKTDVPYGVASDQIAPGSLRVQLFKASHIFTLSSNSVNEFAFGINANDTSPSAGPSTLPRFDFSFLNPFYSAPGPAQFNQIRENRVYQFLDTFTFIKGDHSIKAGVDIRLNRRSSESIRQETLTFFGVQDIANNAPFVIAENGNPRLDYANENFGLFAQDDWKANSRLTLNLGLRYDVSTVSREKNGLLQNFDLTTLTFTPPGQKVYDMDTNNFGPRVGFAFDVFGNKKTVLRGGYGIFYNRELPASWGSPQADTYPSLSVDVFTWLGGVIFGTCDGGSTFQYPVDPRVYNCAVPAAFHIEKDLQTAMAQQWSLNIQQDIGIGTLQVGYVGNHVTHLLTDGVISPRNINRKDPVDGVTRPLSQNFGDIFVVGGYPSSTYHALQATFRRNLSSGLRFNANYTWSHAIDNIAGFFKDYQNENDINADRASSDQDVRHNFTTDLGYDLPFRKWFGDGPKWIIDGWDLNSIVQVRSGLPVNVNVQGGTFGGFSFRPNVVAGVDPYAPTTGGCSGYSVPDCQFNSAAFTAPPAGVFGNAGRNLLRGPSFAQVDLSIGKDTRLSENTSLQLRMEIFNLLNRANFADPSGGLVCTGAVGVCSRFGQSFATVGNQLGGLLGFGGPRQIQLSARFNF